MLGVVDDLFLAVAVAQVVVDVDVGEEQVEEEPFEVQVKVCCQTAWPRTSRVKLRFSIKRLLISSFLMVYKFRNISKW